MAKWITNHQISQMTYNQLGAALVSGELSVKRLRSYYSDARAKALARSARVQKSEFGEISDKPYFSKIKNLTTDRALLHEIADVNKYLKSDRSTITGQKKLREKYIETAKERGFDIDADNYTDWINFIQWFKNSEFALSFDSDSEEVEEAFQEGAGPDEWKKLFGEYMDRNREAVESGSGKKNYH